MSVYPNMISAGCGTNPGATMTRVTTAADEVYKQAADLACRLENTADDMNDKFSRVMRQVSQPPCGENIPCEILPPYYQDLRDVLDRIAKATFAINDFINRAEV